MQKVGSRVGAILSAKEGVVRFFGYGEYVGDEIPPEDTSYITWPNPKIVLDNGEVVWGFQCWWGSEERIKEIIAKNDKVIMVDCKGNEVSHVSS